MGDEWKANSDWIRLSFHALSDQLPKPYVDTDYDTMECHHSKVAYEISRFAGKELLSTTTTIHWAECTKNGVIALRDMGINTLIGLFHKGGIGSYHLGMSRDAWFKKHPVYHDPLTDMIFIKCLVILNSHKLKKIVPTIKKQLVKLQEKGFVEFLINEQYFRKDYSRYQVDACKKVELALEWVKMNGYEPVFWEEVRQLLLEKYNPSFGRRG